jgi:DoxX-like family
MATGLFVLIFGYSAVWSLVDPEGTRIDTVALGFPGYFVYPQNIAKLLGLAAILTHRSRTLTGLAFAGFFYDVVLGLSAHIAQGDWVRGAKAVLGLASTVAAYWAYSQRFGSGRTEVAHSR